MGKVPQIDGKYSFYRHLREIISSHKKEKQDEVKWERTWIADQHEFVSLSKNIILGSVRYAVFT